MSKLAGGSSANGPVRAVGSVGSARSAGGPRRESLLRFDEADDPRRGIDLYEAVVLQETGGLTDGGWLDRLEAIVRLKARLAALEAETVAGFDDVLKGVSADLGNRRPQWGDRAATAGERRWVAGDLRSVADEVALILEMRRGHATTRIHASCELVHNFPATLHALTEGWLTERAAFMIVSELSVLDDLGDIRAAEAAMLDWAHTHPLVEIKKACQREVARRSPAAMDKAYRRAHDERSVRMYVDDLGRADLVHNQDALEASAVMTSLSRAAAHRRRHGDNRTLDQLRADIALERLLPRTKRPGCVGVVSNPNVGESSAGFSSHAGRRQWMDGVEYDPAEETKRKPTGGVEHATTSGAEHAPTGGAERGRTDDADREPAGSTAYAPVDDAGFEPADGAEHTPTRGADRGRADDSDREPVDDATRGPAGLTEFPLADDAKYVQANGAAHSPTGGAEREPTGAGGFEPVDGSEDELADRIDCAAADGVECAVAGCGPSGLQSTVVIHATGAEMLALITGEVATGGEADHHGPIPQAVLRKHVTEALAQSLLPNAARLSSAPGQPHRHAQKPAPTDLGTTPDTDSSASATADGAPNLRIAAGAAPDRRVAVGSAPNAGIAADCAPDTTSTVSSAFAADASTDGVYGGASGGSRIELQLTDQPPPSDPNRYLPSPALDRYVRLRDRTCQFPGCNRPAEFTDLDHRIPFAAGGRTTAANLWCVCRHHHRLKHEGGWQVRSNPDGTHTWISPTGRQYPGGEVVHKRRTPRRKRPGDGHLLW